MEPIVFRAVRAIPELDIAAGDDVVMNPHAPRLFTLCKGIDPAAALREYEAGALAPLDAAPPPADLARAVRSLTSISTDLPPSFGAARTGPTTKRHLRLVPAGEEC